MIKNILKITDQVIWLSYLALAVITPLIFSTQNTELFEVPKMLFVYFLAVIIFFATLIKFVFLGKILIPKSLPLLAFFIFLIIQTLSTTTSIDKFTSVFGYPSRLNGGLLSQFAYLVIFAALLVNFPREKAQKLLIAIVIAAFAVSLWGIPSHFGRDPSCLVLTGKLNSACWQKEFDPKVRIFSTLGQPNWLASYLVLSLPLALSLLLIFKNNGPKIFFLIVTVTLFLAFIFTNSRAGLTGFITSFTAFILLLGQKLIKTNFKILAPAIMFLLILTIIFGNILFSRINEFFTSVPNRQGPTESGQIRLIVWQGAIDIFKHWPILGSGPETFAYAYYLYRPPAHNQTTEWNFFYNKAHNEFLNYLANTGILGTAAYSVFILTTLVTLFQVSRKSPNYSSDKSTAILAKATVASILGYQATIFLGFSTVTSQLLMFLIVGSLLARSKNQEFFIFEIKLFKGKFKNVFVMIYLIFGLFILSFPTRLYLADIFQARARNFEDLNKVLVADSNAVATFPGKNPFYLAEYAYSLTQYASSVDQENTTEMLAQNAAASAQLAEKISPNNLIILRKVANSYLLLSAHDPMFETKAQTLGQRLPQLAPTDPQSYLSLAKIQAGLDKNDDAKKTLESALKLKPDYQEARELFEQLNSTVDTVDN